MTDPSQLHLILIFPGQTLSFTILGSPLIFNTQFSFL